MEEIDLIFILKLFVWSFSILILGSGAIYLGKRIVRILKSKTDSLKWYKQMDIGIE